MNFKWVFNNNFVKHLLSKTDLKVIINSSSLVGATFISSGLGFFFWWLAARRFPPEAVGLASAAISAMTLLGTIGVMGLGTLLLGELPRHPGKAKSLISAALITVGVAGGFFGILFTFLAPWLSPDLHALAANLASIALFCSGVCLTSITMVLDQALIGLMRGGLQLWRNFIFSIAKLGVLLAVSLWFSGRTGLTIYATWAIGNLLSLAIVAGIAWSRQWTLSACLPQWKLLRNLGRLALGHHALNLALQAPGLILPLLVTALLSVRMNAYFYTAWMIANLAFVGPNALATVLYASVSADRPSLVHKIRLTLKLSLLAGLLVNLVLIMGSQWVLNFFGSAYAHEATWCLRLLGLGVFPLIIRTHYVAISRIFERVGRGAIIMSICAVFELVLAASGAKAGSLTGLALGWLVSICIEAVLMSATVFRVAVARDTKAPSPSLDGKVTSQVIEDAALLERETNKH